MNTTTLAGIDLPITQLDTLVLSRGDTKQTKEDATKLVPVMEGFVEEDQDPVIRKLALGVKRDQAVLMCGPKGTGKTTSVYYLASQTNNPLVSIQLTGGTGVDTLLGKWLAGPEGTYWVDGIFTMARRHGYWIVLDELNMAMAEVLAALHSALDDRRILVLDEKDGEVIKRHPNCKIFAAINPSEDYAGTKELNAALIDRFPGYLEVKYPSAEKEINIIRNHKKVLIDDKNGTKTEFGIITRMVRAANAMRKLHASQELIFECSTRNLIDRACRCSEVPVKEAFEFAISGKADIGDRSSMQDIIDKEFRDNERWTVGGPIF